MSGLRLGFIGLGHITQNAHLAPLSELVESGDVVFQAFCDVHEETASEQAKKWGAKSVYTDYRAMFDAEELDAVYDRAKEAGLTVHMVVDSGKTEFDGIPTKTCLAIGPHEASKIDKITGNLKLL